jgi:integrase/recombinase XerD
MKPTDIARYLTQFLTYYLSAQRNLSPNTIASYRDTFMLLLRYCQEQRHISVERLRLDQLTIPLILGFLDHLEKERHCTARTRNQRLAALHVFFRYLQIEVPSCMMQCQQILAIPFRRYERIAFPYLSVEDLSILVSQPDTATVEGRRHAVLLTVLYDTGARVQEVIDLCVQHVRLDSPAQVKLMGKGRKMRIVPLMSKTVAILKEYMQEHALFGENCLNLPLFSNRHGQRLSRSGIRYLITKYSNKGRQQYPQMAAKITPHTLRHTKAMHLLQAGNPLNVIQSILGHVDIKTCTIYASADLEMKRKALEKTDYMTPKISLPSWKSNKNILDWLRSL